MKATLVITGAEPAVLQDHDGTTIKQVFNVSFVTSLTTTDLAKLLEDAHGHTVQVEIKKG